MRSWCAQVFWSGQRFFFLFFTSKNLLLEPIITRSAHISRTRCYIIIFYTTRMVDNNNNIISNTPGDPVVVAALRVLISEAVYNCWRSSSRSTHFFFHLIMVIGFTRYYIIIFMSYDLFAAFAARVVVRTHARHATGFTGGACGVGRREDT